MVTQIQAAEYYLSLYLADAIYVWGMNAPDIITREKILETYERYHTTKYDREYYEDKLVEGYGHIGSDCSGAHHGISGYDDTAQGYYNQSIAKGNTKEMSKDKVIPLYRGKATNKIEHTGVYIPGFGMFHMKSSAENAVLETFDKNYFKYFGYADFINYSSKNFVLREHYDLWTAVLQHELNKSYNCGLEVDGIFGSKTLEATTSIGYLRKGSKGKFVLMLQNFLNSIYGDVLVPDADFGKATREQVMRFQKNCGLEADGIVGHDTWLAIKKRIKL